MNTTRHGAMARIADTCADDAEVLALSAIRMIAAGYSTGNVECWDMAYTGAERVLPTEAAGRLVASLTVLVRALRTERVADWHFMPATCCRVTRDEESVVRLLNAVRGGAAPAVRRAALDVTGMPISAHLQSAAQVVARLLDEVSGTLTTRAPRHPEVSVQLH